IPANTAAFLRGQLPVSLTARIGWSKLKHLPGTFVDGRLTKAESDLLFSVPFDGTPSLLYILFEHQHDKDPWIALRLLRYMLEIWREFLAKNPSARKLPVILPIVLAQNATKWDMPTRFSELLDLPATNPEPLHEFTPDFTFRLIQLAEIPFDEIQGTNTGIMILRTLKASQVRGLLGDEVWDEVTLARLSRPIFRLLVLYILNSADVDKETFRHKLEQLEASKLKESAMTLAEQLHEEGMQQGMQQGQVASKQQDILEALKLRFKRVPAGLREEIESVGNIAKLQSLHRAAILSQTLDEFAEAL
ncbi:MAG: Rpn family recombination-promoting nuclease/putative transposase, partial [Rhodoferax sp.]|nr:Rpn family recombination-promoting nuclease/putative transposase [Rhodoferax sp.]